MASNGSKKPDSIKDALNILDEALAGQNASFREIAATEAAKEPLKPQSRGLQDTWLEITQAVKGFSTQAFERAAQMSTDLKSTSAERSRQLYSGALTKSRDVYGGIDASVRENPWPLIGGVAVATFALGFIFGRGGPLPLLDSIAPAAPATEPVSTLDTPLDTEGEV